ncbi:MAG TPA: gamma-glutamyltransferase, partial [Phycisphaerales bacterium]|nr:gamma-glutamyltransferase [Phycisphaerales bacterium]
MRTWHRWVPGVVMVLSVGSAAIQAAQTPHGSSDQAPGHRAGHQPTSDSGEFSRCVVAGTTSPESVKIGLEVLQNAGSAADAAIATSIAQIVHAGGAWNSFAGIFMMLYYDAQSGQTHSLNAGYNTVLAEDDSLSIPVAGTPSGRATLVPGFMAGVGAAHARFGRLPLADLIRPSVDIAEGGLVITPIFEAVIAMRVDVLRRRDQTWRIFSDSHGRPLRAGDLFRQEDLARTLRAVSTDGVRAMYVGDWAESLVEAVGSEGGHLSLEDLRRYEVIWSDPVRTTYRGHEVAAIGLPELGGVQLAEALNLCEAMMPGRAVDPSSPRDLFSLMQIARFGYLPSAMVPTVTAEEPAVDGHAQAVGRAAFCPRRRAGKEHASRHVERFAKEDWERTLTLELGRPNEVPSPDASGHSDAVVAVDSLGNIAVVVHSSNNNLWGSTGIFVGGVSIPDSANFQQQRALLTGPGRRLPNASNPAMAFRDGRPILACGAIGSGLNEATLQNMINVLDLGLDPAASLRRPAFLTPDWSTLMANRPGRNAQQVTDGDFPADLLDQVRAMGQPVIELSPTEAIGSHGYWAGVWFGPDRRMRAGVSTLISVPGAVA